MDCQTLEIIEGYMDSTQGLTTDKKVIADLVV